MHVLPQAVGLTIPDKYRRHASWLLDNRFIAQGDMVLSRMPPQLQDALQVHNNTQGMILSVDLGRRKVRVHWMTEPPVIILMDAGLVTIPVQNAQQRVEWPTLRDSEWLREPPYSNMPCINLRNVDPSIAAFTNSHAHSVAAWRAKDDETQVPWEQRIEHVRNLGVNNVARILTQEAIVWRAEQMALEAPR